jgi:hypothetical protein
MEKLKGNGMGGSFYSKEDLDELKNGNFAGVSSSAILAIK